MTSPTVAEVYALVAELSDAATKPPSVKRLTYAAYELFGSRGSGSSGNFIFTHSYILYRSPQRNFCHGVCRKVVFSATVATDSPKTACL